MTRRFALLLLVLALFDWPALAQVQEVWIARYNGPVDFDDQARAMAVDGAGNVYVTGVACVRKEFDDETGEFFCVDTDYATVKYDSSGNQLWVARYPGGGLAIALDAWGNIYVTGWSGGPTELDYATIKYDADGNELWVARYDNPSTSRWDAAHAIALDNSGNAYVTGMSQGFGTSFDYATIKYDPSGTQLWVSRYDGPGSTLDRANAIALDAAGNAYVTGSSLVFGLGEYYYATIKYDPDGNEVWVARDRAGYDGAKAIALDASGNVTVTGESITIQYDTDGNQRWAVSRWGAGLSVDAAGNVHVMGGNAAVKYDTQGDRVWIVSYNGVGTAIALDAAGHVYMTGSQYGGPATGADYATVKYAQQ